MNDKKYVTPSELKELIELQNNITVANCFDDENASLKARDILAKRVTEILKLHGIELPARVKYKDGEIIERDEMKEIP
jgi:phosphoribosylanthranilate isomerase